MDDEDFLAAVEADNANVPAEEPKEVTAEQPLELTEEAPPEEAAAEPALPEPKPEPILVPIQALHETRDEVKALRAKLEALEPRQKPPEPQPLPDMFEDQEGFTTALVQEFDQRLYAQSLQMSKQFAINKYGEETTVAAAQWAEARCDADPYFNAQVRNSGDPVGFAVREYQKNQIVQTVTPEDLAQFRAWKAAQAAIQASAPSNPAAPPNPSRTLPPRSLASAPSAGGVMTEVDQSDEEIFAEVLPKR